MTEGDHHLSHVQKWVAHRLHPLTACLQQEVRLLDWGDDRLAKVLDLFSDDERWAALERA